MDHEKAMAYHDDSKEQELNQGQVSDGADIPMSALYKPVIHGAPEEAEPYRTKQHQAVTHPEKPAIHDSQ